MDSNILIHIILTLNLSLNFKFCDKNVPLHLKATNLAEVSEIGYKHV